MLLGSVTERSNKRDIESFSQIIMLVGHLHSACLCYFKPTSLSHWNMTYNCVCVCSHAGVCVLVCMCVVLVVRMGVYL